jgi:hypothetical protein
MKNLLAAALLSLPLATLAGDPPKATDTKPASKEATQTDGKADAKAKAGTKTGGKDAASAKGQTKADAKAGKQEEKPCEPVKPCSID